MLHPSRKNLKGNTCTTVRTPDASLARRRSLVLAVAILATATSGCTDRPSPTQAATGLTLQAPPTGARSWSPTPVSSLGVNPGGWTNAQAAASGDSVMKVLRWAGFGWVRFDFDWSIMEPTGPGLPFPTNDSNGTDPTLRSAKAAGMQVLGTIDYAPAWANGGHGSHFGPDDAHLADWKRYVGRLIETYGSQVDAWTIWNEPDCGDFFNVQDSSSTPWVDRQNRYATLVALAMDTIRAAQPGAQILVGEVTNAAECKVANPATLPTDPSAREKYNRDWLAGVLRLIAPRVPDAVSIHLYGTGQDIVNVIDRPDRFSMMWVENPDLTRVPVWLTEFGPPANAPYQQDEGLQAAQIDTVIRASSDPNRSNHDWQKSFFFGATQHGQQLIDGWQDGGVVVPPGDLTPRYALYAVKFLTTQTSPSSPFITYGLKGQSFGWHMASDGGVAAVAVGGRPDDPIAFKVSLAPWMTQRVLGRVLSVHYHTYFSNRQWVHDNEYPDTLYADGAQVGPFYDDPSGSSIADRIEAVEVRLLDAIHNVSLSHQVICYQVQVVSSTTWQPYAPSSCDDATAGPEGQNVAIKAIRIGRGSGIDH
jgi:polysaccharide biosynthesis protein PslG